MQCCGMRHPGAPRSRACPSSSGPSTSARPRIRPCSTLPSRSRGRLPRRWPRWLERREWSWSARSSSGGAAGVYHNTAVVLDTDGALRGRYRKMHIPDDPLYYEKYYFTPGDLGFKTFPTRFGRVGTLVCWDQWYPEAARLTALKGAEILFYPTAIGWHPAEKAEFGAGPGQRLGDDAALPRDRQRRVRRAPSTGSATRALPDGGLEFWGGSFLADPFGRILARAGQDTEEILIVRMRPEAPGGDPPQLAVPPRPPDRRLRANHPAIPGPR